MRNPTLRGELEKIDKTRRPCRSQLLYKTRSPNISWSHGLPQILTSHSRPWRTGVSFLYPHRSLMSVFNCGSHCSLLRIRTPYPYSVPFRFLRLVEVSTSTPGRLRTPRSDNTGAYQQHHQSQPNTEMGPEREYFSSWLSLGRTSCKWAFPYLYIGSAVSAVRVVSRSVSLRPPGFGVSTGHLVPSPSKTSANHDPAVPEPTQLQPG
jgi:hypothetical protein